MGNRYDYDNEKPWTDEGVETTRINFAGIAWEEVEETRYEGGGKAPAPAPGAHIFRISEVKSGIQQRGDNAGSPYFTVKCQVVGETGELLPETVWKFCGFGTNPTEKGYRQISDTKAFLVDIGREDLMQRGTTLDEQALIETEFKADVYEWLNRKTDEKEAKIKNIEPVSHAKAPARKAAPAPEAARPIRGRK